ncbi:uncharacterized protein A4U43_C05F18480 [Asparagus officinalis]|uniref:Protein SCAR n=1 Tax=Asparagus officinalis TaxID=4686 RepID=A0A5P1ETM6_ASPOF|nr:protein SCAR3-like [Asparagus officinalis]ONK69023.1 uncharacterized protein A4U43_C05F18480 [Asparagus officinalis]
MPLVRFEVRNEYALGDPELYLAEAKEEDPRAILDGVAVAGLVGILRQLGDLAEFAADIFHDLHEQVTSTAARGKRMQTRIQRIESALSPIEKAIQGQRSYIHFAYIAGSDWHAKVRTGQNQLLCCDLPQYMIDFYEECCDPPRLYLLDKFDSSGAGACLKRYSDPSYFRRALVASEPVKAEKIKRKRKKRGSRLRNEGIQHPMFASLDSNSTQFASPGTGQLSFSGENVSFFDTRSKSELGKESLQFDSENRANSVEQVSQMPPEQDYDEFSDPALKSNQSIAVLDDPKQDIVDDDSQPESSQQQSAPSTSSVTWDEKTEIVKPTGANVYDAELVDSVQGLDSPPQIVETSNIVHETANFGTVKQEDIVFELANAPVSYDEVPPGMDINTPVSCPDGNLPDNVCTVTDNFKDAIDVVEPEIKAVSECQNKSELKSSNSTNGVLESNSCRLNETSATNADCFDAQAPIAPCSSSNGFVLSDGFDHIQSTNTNCFSPASNSSVGNDYFKSHVPCVPGISISEPLEGEFSLETSMPNEQDVPVNNVNADKITKSQDHPSNTSDLPTVSIWTNGGILGLAPSKPPDFSVNGNSEAVAVCNESTSKASSENERAKSDGESQEADVAAPGSDLTTFHSTGLHSSGSDKNSTGISTSFSGLANKFLSTNLQRKILFAHAGLSKPSQLVNDDFRKLQEILLQNDHQELPKKAVLSALCEPETEEIIEEPVPSSSPTFGSSSPPLEHMNLSFHPMNSLETSKLKLEFASGDLHEGIRDLVCPSFHLIPASFTTVQDSCSESDDDTFCRSSVYSSDDLPSLHSESNSELWGEHEISESQKHSVSDNSCRISSSTTSNSGSAKFEQTASYNTAPELEHLEVENGGISDSVRDLLSVNSVIYDKRQQQICEPLPTDFIDSAAYPQSELPPPPPLPPLQWRVAKQSDSNHSVESMDSAFMKATSHLDPQAQRFRICDQKEQDEPSSSCSAENRQMLNGARGLNHNYDFAEQNGRKKLLQQIRSKSFNLRCTITKPNHT